MWTPKPLLMAASFVAAIALAPLAAEAANVKVGYIATFTGPEAANGINLDRGVQLYLKLHPQVPGGHTVELIKRDDGGPAPDRAKRLAEELITRDGVQLIAGIIYSNNAFAKIGRAHV